jgi:hypothetical protein
VITLSTFVYDPLGHVEIAELNYSPRVDRRLNRVATLDGESVFNDFGFSYSDMTFTFEWTPVSADYEAMIERLVRQYATLLFSGPNGIFKVRPQSYIPGETSTMTLLAERILSS